MKKHAIIPIFIPHLGCPCKCVFCNQQKITAKEDPVTASQVRDTVERYLSTLQHLDAKDIEIAFYGGSFTAIPVKMQTEYLKIANEYIEAKRVSSLHLSTRPDCIDRDILDNLKHFNVDTIELGVQSFDDDVLRMSKRGHDSNCVRQAAKLISDYGFKLGIQLMIGLPGDSLKSCIFSAKEAVKLKPELARLYPTLVIDGTELYDMYKAGQYDALSREEALLRTKEMYRILRDADINIMRVGLKSTDIIGDGTLSAINGGTYHPAFRQLVEGELAYEDLREKLLALAAKACASPHAPNIKYNADNADFGRDLKLCKRESAEQIKVGIFSHPASFSNMIGNSGINKIRLKSEFPCFNIKYGIDKSLSEDTYVAKLK